MSGLTSVDAACAEILARLRPLAPRLHPLRACRGLVLAQDVVSPVDHPPFDNAAMDGYALRSQDSREQVSLEVVGEIAAGRVAEFGLAPGQCAAIMTGAMLCPGADAVVMQEEVHRDGDRLELNRAVPAGENVRRAGEHMAAGEVALSAGRQLGPAEIALAAYLGYPELLCHPRPRVGILSTGTELVAPGTALGPGQIYNSNAYALEALLGELGCESVNLGTVPDDPDQIEACLRESLPHVDAWVTSAGVSVGRHDYVLSVLRRMGGELGLWKLAMRPGKPLAFGSLDGRAFFALPGNPVSCMVTFEVVCAGALRHLAGLSPEPPEQWFGRLEHPIDKKVGLRFFHRGRVKRRAGELWVALTGPQDSNRLRSLVEGDVLLDLPEAESHLAAGTSVRLRPLWKWRGGKTLPTGEVLTEE